MDSKNIIVIGATSGIGRAVAEIYISQGHKVGVTGRRENLLKEAAHIVYDECGPVLALYASNSYCVMREGLENVLVTKGAGPYFRYARVDEAVWNE